MELIEAVALPSSHGVGGVLVRHGGRQGEYLGKTVQVVPHITNAIGDWIERGKMRE